MNDQITVAIKELAEDAARKFVRKDDRVIYIGDPNDWICAAIRLAHGPLMPDNYVYEMVHDAFEFFAQADSGRETYEVIDSFCEVNNDAYTSNLLRWLSSNPNRLDYCDEAATELGLPKSASMTQRIGLGQYCELQIIANAVLLELEAQELLLDND